MHSLMHIYTHTHSKKHTHTLTHELWHSDTPMCLHVQTHVHSYSHYLTFRAFPVCVSAGKRELAALTGEALTIGPVPVETGDFA